MSDNVIKLYTKDAADNPDNVLERAIGEYDKVFVLGYNKDDYLDARASTNMKQSDLLWLIEQFKHSMISGEYGDE